MEMERRYIDVWRLPSRGRREEILPSKTFCEMNNNIYICINVFVNELRNTCVWEYLAARAHLRRIPKGLEIHGN
jgi:hypothetical protein